MLRTGVPKLLCFMLSAGLANWTSAAPPPVTMVDVSDTGNQQGLFDFLNGINRSDALLGNMWGARNWLSRYGISFAVEETIEYIGNTSGGSKTGFEYDGLTQVLLQMDTQRAFGHYGGLINVSLLNTHGNNLSANQLYSLQAASGIEADPSIRLWEAWYDQKFLDEDRLDVKVGQQSLDQEYMVSQNALYFINTLFGWPMLPSADLPGGGPAYPLSVLGARLAARPVDGINILAGVYNGTPVNNQSGDPQLSNAHGTSFPWGGGVLAITEIQWSYPALGSMVSPGDSQPLGWTYKLGAWYDSRSFNDLRENQFGQSLVDPAGNGVPRQHQGDYAVYAVMDQLLWRDQKDPNHTLSAYARVMGTPLTDRNLIDFSMNAGLLMHSPFNYRTDDTFGLGIGYAHVSDQASLLDQQTNQYNNSALPIRSSETNVELTYQYQLKPWIQLQPDVQYTINPGGGAANPFNPSQRIGNEWVVGLRSNINF